MKIISETHTHDMGGGNVYKPGQAFDCPTTAAKKKIEAGTARAANGDDGVVALQLPNTNDTGSGDTGSGDTGSGDTGSGDTGSGDTGSGDGDGAGAATEPTEPPTGQAREDAILEAALGLLDSTDAELFTGSGAPKTTALEAVLGFDVTAAERNAAWSEVTDDDGEAGEGGE